MKMKTVVVFVLGLMLTVSSGAWCMPGGGPGGPPGFLPPNVMDSLNLSDDQQTEIDTIQATYEDQIKDLQSQMMDEIKAVLTDEQAATLEEFFQNAPKPPEPQQ